MLLKHFSTSNQASSSLISEAVSCQELFNSFLLDYIKNILRQQPHTETYYGTVTYQKGLDYKQMYYME